MQEINISEEKLADILMSLIDSFIALQLIAKNLKPKERYEFLVKKYREILADDFEHITKHHNDCYEIYLHKIRNKESGPYSKTAFDINHQPNLLNL